MRYATLLLILLTSILCGCDGSYVRNAEAQKEYTIAVRAQNDAILKAREDAMKAVSGAADKCTNDSCREHIASMSAMLGLGSGGGTGGGLQPIAQQQREPSAWEKAGALSNLAGIFVNGAVSIRQSDNARDISVAQYHVLDQAMSGVTGAAAGFAQAGPRIDVQGNYGPTYGDNYTGGNHEDVGGSRAGRDILGQAANSGTQTTTTTTTTTTDTHPNSGCLNSDCSGGGG